jgi:serine/threonine-protein kinase
MNEGAGLASASVVDVADLLLAGALKRGAATVFVDSTGETGTAQLTDGKRTRWEISLPVDLARALILRLGVLAGLDSGGGDGQPGRLRVRCESLEGEFLVLVDQYQARLEARRVAAGPSQVTAVSTAADAASPAQVGPYQVTALIGRGGMGVVFRGEHQTSGRPVAVKVLHAHVAADPRLAAQFVREARAASLAKHPGIVDVMDFGDLPDGRAFLVMELVTDRTLETALREGPFEMRRAVTIARRIARVLEAAHVRGVIHRDLKPSNVFLDPQDGVKLADFGAARILPTGGESGGALSEIVIGTPLYMAPEQAQGRRTDERADVYSLGCMLFTMLCGYPPFRGEALADRHYRDSSIPVPAIRSPYGPVPDALSAVVERALARHPEERHQSAGEVGVELDHVLAGLGGEARRR